METKNIIIVAVLGILAYLFLFKGASSATQNSINNQTGQGWLDNISNGNGWLDALGQLFHAGENAYTNYNNQQNGLNDQGYQGDGWINWNDNG